MSYKGLPEHLVARIGSVDARQYATASGWQRVGGVQRSRIAIFKYPGSDLDQLLIPLDNGIADYPRRMAEVVTTLAEKEERPAGEILDDLLLPPSDVLRFRLDEPASRSGFLPLDQGIELLKGARKALLSAACSVIQPQRFHPRLSRTEAERLVRSSHLGQSERGSYTAVVSCPIEEEPPHLPGGGQIPFARRTTDLLMRSLARVSRALEADEPESLLEAIRQF